MLGCKGLREITMNVSIAKMNIDIKCAVFRNCIPGGGGKLNVVLHTPPYRKDFPRI